MSMKFIGSFIAASFACLSSASAGLIVSEVGDAGDTASLAAHVGGYGDVSSIVGSIEEPCTGICSTFSDVDFYSINITDVDAFSATLTGTVEAVDPAFSAFDNGLELYLFDSSFNLVGFDSAVNVDGSIDPSGALLPSGLLSGQASGTYFLAVTIFFSTLGAAPGTIDVIGFPPLAGAYNVALQGVSAVPIPGALPLFVSALVAGGMVRKKRKSASA